MAETPLIPKFSASTEEPAVPEDAFFLHVKRSALFFIASLLVAASMYAYAYFLGAQVEQKKAEIKAREAGFKEVSINDLYGVSAAMSAGRELLAKHSKSSRLFSLIEASASPSVTFHNFSFAMDKKTIALSGDAQSYLAVSEQADAFESLEEVLSVALSGLTLQPDGRVAFYLTMLLK